MVVDHVLGFIGLLFFFFFQAEDGIRDLTVTGVQTCALPICACTPAGAADTATAGVADMMWAASPGVASSQDRERGVEGKRVDLGGRRIIKKKKKKKETKSRAKADAQRARKAGRVTTR